MSHPWLCFLPSDELHTSLMNGWRDARHTEMLQRFDAFPRPIRLLKLRGDTSYRRYDLVREVRQRPIIALRSEALIVSPNLDCEHVVAPLISDNLYPWEMFVANLRFRLHPLFADSVDHVWRPQVMLTCSGRSGLMDPSWNRSLEPFAWHPRSFAIVEATPTGHRYIDVFHV